MKEILSLEQNDISGAANELCSVEYFNTTTFAAAADCGGSKPKVDCSCCQICCEGKDSCDQWYNSAKLDASQEASYRRDKYDFENLVLDP